MDCVGEVRGRGLLAAVELVVDKRSKAKPATNVKLGQHVLKHAFEEGLVFRAFADDILGFAPSLNYTVADIDTLMDILTHAINKAVASSL